MHVFFTSQGDILKLGLKSSSLSGAFLKTLPPIFILFHFHLNYTEHTLALASTKPELRLPNYSRTNHVHPGQKDWLL